MNRVLTILCEQLADTSTDRQLLDRFLGARDEAAFAELVRRYGPVVWGACRRRLTNPQDAEDAFQATFLVLIRRAGKLNADVPLGPWLYKVAVMTAGNVLRSNRRRGAISGPMEHEPPATRTDPTDAQLDLDAALLALPERDRLPVVLCHLQGLTRREAAERIGCPEGTLSARLNRALRRLRARLGDRAAAVLGAGAVAVPAGLASATARCAAVYSTSAQTAGVSPVVAGLTDGVIRMFWMKKAMAATCALALVLGAGALVLGPSVRATNVAQATEPLPDGAPPAKAPEEPDPIKRLEKRLAELDKQRAELDKTAAELAAEKAQLEEVVKRKKAAEAAAALGPDLQLVVAKSDNKLTYTLREVVAGKVAELSTSDFDAVALYLARTHQDPKGPKQMRLQFNYVGQEQKHKVFAACVAAGYQKALVAELTTVTYSMPQVAERYVHKPVHQLVTKEVDLTKYAEPKKP